MPCQGVEGPYKGPFKRPVQGLQKTFTKAFKRPLRALYEHRKGLKKPNKRIVLLFKAIKQHVKTFLKNLKGS